MAVRSFGSAHPCEGPCGAKYTRLYVVQGKLLCESCSALAQEPEKLTRAKPKAKPRAKPKAKVEVPEDPEPLEDLEAPSPLVEAEEDE